MENKFKKYIPNIITIFRFILVFPFLIFIHSSVVYNNSNLFSLILFIAILVSDVLDGYFSRKLNCITITGAKLDIASDTFYSISSLFIFAYFKIIPIWFPIILGIKLLEFTISSKIIKNKYKINEHIIFDRIGKIAVNIVMLMPGIFIFRCLITGYKNVMNIVVYFVTVLIIMSFLRRMVLIFRLTK